MQILILLGIFAELFNLHFMIFNNELYELLKGNNLLSDTNTPSNYTHKGGYLLTIFILNLADFFSFIAILSTQFYAFGILLLSTTIANLIFKFNKYMEIVLSIWVIYILQYILRNI